MEDKYLFMMVAVIVAPTLVILIVQVATFPLTLHTVTTVDEVCNQFCYNDHLTVVCFRMIFLSSKYTMSAKRIISLYFKVFSIQRMAF